MPELLEVDPFGGKTLFAFDGRVLEIFGKVATRLSGCSATPM